MMRIYDVKHEDLGVESFLIQMSMGGERLFVSRGYRPLMHKNEMISHHKQVRCVDMRMST